MLVLYKSAIIDDIFNVLH